MRKLAGFTAHVNPDILAVCEIGSGDTRSLATRFAMQWAYRGRQALMWKNAFAPETVKARYLPAANPFDRRGLVLVDGALHDKPCTLVTTQFASRRAERIAQLSFVRARLEGVRSDALFFASIPVTETHFDDLGFREAGAPDSSNERVYVRGFDSVKVRAVIATV